MHSDIAALHVLGMIHSAVILVGFQTRYDLLAWGAQYTNSMEMLAYMPAVWMLAVTDHKLLAFEPLSQVVSQRQAIWFLVWITAFNVYEDGISMVMSGLRDPHFVAGHVLHFLILLDFSSFFLHQSYISKVA